MFVLAKDYYTLSINEFSSGNLVVNYNYSISFGEENDNMNTTYFSDYLISIEAVPEEGYQFIGWIINETDSGTNIIKPGETSVRNNNYETIEKKILIKPDSNITIKPIFN